MDRSPFSFRALLEAQAARELVVSFELHVDEIVVHAVIDHGELAVHPGPLAGVDAVIDAGPLLQGMLTGEVTVAQALDSGKVSVTGDPELLSTFAELFRLPKLSTPVPA
jgi:ubiquinone biosynthesis protein UbiJ